MKKYNIEELSKRILEIARKEKKENISAIYIAVKLDVSMNTAYKILYLLRDSPHPRYSHE